MRERERERERRRKTCQRMVGKEKINCARKHSPPFGKKGPSNRVLSFSLSQKSSRLPSTTFGPSRRIGSRTDERKNDEKCRRFRKRVLVVRVCDRARVDVFFLKGGFDLFQTHTPPRDDDDDAPLSPPSGSESGHTSKSVKSATPLSRLSSISGTSKFDSYPMQ